MLVLGMNQGPLQEESVLSTPVSSVQPCVAQPGLKILASRNPPDSGSCGPGSASVKKLESALFSIIQMGRINFQITFPVTGAIGKNVPHESGLPPEVLVLSACSQV